MKRAWMRFWLCTSTLAVVAAAGVLGGGFAQTTPTPKHANELTLAGLRPGRDTLATAKRRYRTRYGLSALDEDGSKVWTEGCTGRSLRVELDAKGLIQSMTITALAPRRQDCGEKRGEFLGQNSWATGRGLKLGAPQNRVVELYGEPNLSGPSVKGGRELEFLFYTFDWAGSEVPQVMEVSCERENDRVVEITLAFPSL